MAKLIFIYNADAGLVNVALDIAHKVLSPDTYSCNLCMLTHDTFTERSAWQAFRESYSVPMEFLHKDEYEQKVNDQNSLKSKKTHSYPIILKEDQGQIDIFIDTPELNEIKDVNRLINTIQERL
ncbi:GTPase [Acaryochloris sp. 'Moss Beach']|uniref:GTPase n=1 Tax=Acaryochloris sp. 'Moss Beach' TaxID=2740837 RepID=UPI001F3F3CBF|nr:GTPase [Acaryochloris sp. 'Moss Beach']UJB70238.1 GTPase [Acaryochloris sp. 'Moss Beach']